MLAAALNHDPGRLSVRMDVLGIAQIGILSAFSRSGFLVVVLFMEGDGQVAIGRVG